MKQLINYPDKAPDIHLQDVSLLLAYLQKFPGK
jgi:hypothetical protein